MTILCIFHSLCTHIAEMFVLQANGMLSAYHIIFHPALPYKYLPRNLSIIDIKKGCHF